VISNGIFGTGCELFFEHPKSSVPTNRIKINCTFITFFLVVDKVMKFKTIYTILLLLTMTMASGCGSTAPKKTPATVEEAQKQLAKQSKKNAKIAKKAEKAAHKRYWGAQSKEAKKSVKKNKKRQKRIARHRNKKRK